MEQFILRIFFSGLIAFVPSTDGKELTVLLMETHGHALSDGTALAHHKPVLLARAKTCDGDCNRSDAEIADFLFAGQTASQAVSSLGAALEGGGAWSLANSELTLLTSGLQPPLVLQNKSVRTKSIPQTSSEREDFRWVADLKQVLPAFGKLNPALFASRPPKEIVVARFRVKHGRFSTYSLVRVDGKVVPVHFRTLSGKGEYAQAAANWVEAKIQVPGDSIEVVARDFDSGAERSMKLRQANGLVEMAILNLPPFHAPAPGMRRPLPLPGRHFEAFYELAKNPAAPNRRPVPQVEATKVQADWQALHPHDALWSALLEKLGFEPGRGPYDVLLCPMGQANQP